MGVAVGDSDGPGGPGAAAGPEEALLGEQQAAGLA
jgi:hypothetical protein